MPFREKARNLFKSKNRSSSSSNSSSTNESNHDVYKPGEKMPFKYRRAPNKEHTEKLEAFSFADAWRKTSFQSSHSPMGTRAQSRRESMFSLGRASRRSVVTADELDDDDDAERATSVTSTTTDDNDELSHQVTITPAKRVVTQRKVDDDAMNSGLARTQSRPMSAESQSSGLYKISTALDHRPFSEQDLANALRRSQLQISAH